MVEIRGKLGGFLLDGLFPVECFSCGEYGSWWCSQCQGHVPLLTERRCLGCNRVSAHGETCYECLKGGYPLDGFLAAAAYYEPQIQEAVSYLKYDCVRDLSRPLALLAAHVFQNSRLTDEWWHMVPIPLHVRRERMRGFNQSDLLAHSFSGQTGITVLPLVRRVRATHPQMELSAKERRENMGRDVFAVTDPDLISGKNILLIDDVATTGSTLAAGARVLKIAGAAKVWGITVAHG